MIMPATEAAIIASLKDYYDPELGIDVYTLGFVRRIGLDKTGTKLDLIMTLTSPMCPHGPTMVRDLEERLKRLGLKTVNIELVFDPPWEPSAEVKRMLGL